MQPVPLGKECIFDGDGPGDSKSRIVPRQTQIVIAIIELRNFVCDFAIGFERTKTMGKPRWNPKLRAVVGAQNDRNEFAECRSAASNVHSDIKYGTPCCANQFALREGGRLKVQPSDYTLNLRKRKIILDEVDVADELSK